MAERRRPVAALLLNPWFLTGVALGVLSGLPMVVPNFDDVVPNELRTVLVWLGAPAINAMLFVMWNFGLWFGVAAFAAGCIVNGLVLAGIVEGVRRASLFIRSTTGGGVGPP